MKRRTIVAASILAATLLVAVLVWFAARHGPGEKIVSDHDKPLPTPEQIAKLPPDGGKELNRLIHETSPYLLQHADNPVDWYPWGPEALARAKAEDKPIFLSVGYSACHWCHVMERESFARRDVAEILNEHYVAIKVDREERPDVDKVYMLATQIMTGSGGWPNSLWLTPDGKPWYAGTYFPREDSSNRPGFKTVLRDLGETWRTRRKDVDAQAERIASQMKQYSSATRVKSSGELSYELLLGATKALSRAFDPEHGGFGGAPKFPPHDALALLFQEYRRTKDKALLTMATTTLDAMGRGGIRDHLAGGFHRYSTDAKWFLPHFEKMLYDNALIARAYVDGWLLTGDERYKQVAIEVYEWILQEMAHESGVFYSALDADSEGEEGKFYLWSRKEILEILGAEEGEVFCNVYGVTDQGNFRDEATGNRLETNILYLRDPIPAGLSDRLAAGRRKLLARRNLRIRPHRDDKVLVNWNALMIGSLAYGGQHLKEPRYVAAAEKAANFILNRMQAKGRLLRTFRSGKAKLDAYLDDYAFLADALIDVYEANGDKRWLGQAQRIAQDMQKYYGDSIGGGFFFSAADHEELLLRTKDPFDSATPAGNAVAARLLARLGRHTGRKEYIIAAGQTLKTFLGFMEQVPAGTASLLSATGTYLDAAGS